MNDSRTIIIPPRPKLVLGDGRAVLLLGIELRLTEGEHALLKLISDLAPQPVNAHDAGLSASALAASVCHINKKAALISGRRLIVTCRGKGYTLSKYI